MNSKGVIEGLKQNYPSGLHPSEQQQKDMLRTMKALKYGPVELSKLYDELLRRCEFFPKVADIISCASAIALPLRPKTPEKMYRTFEDDDGRPWAKVIGTVMPEGPDARERRWVKEGILWQEGGREHCLQGFLEAKGDIKSEYWKAISGEVAVPSKPAVSDYDDSVGAIEWQFEGETGSLDDL